MEMTRLGTKRWIDFIQHFTDEMNNTKHSRMKMKPSEMTQDREEEIMRRFYATPRPLVMPRYRVGDQVRISRRHHVFDKATRPTFSPSLYVVAEINRKYPVVYRLDDIFGKRLLQTFYEPEIKKVGRRNFFLIDKIKKIKNNQALVSYRGYEHPKYDQWIPIEFIEPADVETK
jgi:hypothetical protein